MRSMRSVQRQVELTQLGNQLPVLGKANSVCKVVTFCEFCRFATLSGPRDKEYAGCGLSKLGQNPCSVEMMDFSTSCAPEILPPAFYAFSSALSRFFVR